MRVLLAHCYYRSSAPSGEDSVYKSERRLLESHNIDVIPLEKYNDDVNVSGFTNSVKTAINTTWSKSSYNEVTLLIKKFKPDIAHFHNTFPQLSPSVYKACHDNGVPVVQTLHNYRIVCPGAMLLRDGKSCELCLNGSTVPFYSLKYRCYRNSFTATSSLALMIARNRLTGTYKNFVTRYIALTHFAKERFIRGGLPVELIAIKPNYLSNEVKVSFESEDYAVFVGRLSEEKGIKTLLDAWSGVNNLKLKVLGDGHLRKELEDLSNKSNIDIEFLGFRTQEEVLDIVKNAMIQIIPSECYEGFPMSVLEAFACGTPIIASRLGSLQEIISDGQTGVLFEAMNSSDLLVKVRELMNDHDKRMRLALNARKVFDKEYSQEVNFETLMDIYNDVMREKRNF